MKHTSTTSLTGKVRRKRMSALITIFAVLIAASSCKSGGDNKGNNKGAASTSAYTPMQQVFCLNILSNISAHFNGVDTGGQLLKTGQAIDSVLGDAGIQGLIGTWTRVWGPVIYSIHDTALNTMYIAQQAGTLNYVVAIAGTDAVSKLDWILEDFNLKTVPWNMFNHADSSVKITAGTAFGLNMLKLKFGTCKVLGVPVYMPAYNYLSLIADAHFRSDTAINVWVTGHSLGGALSPSYALFLHDSWAAAAGPGSRVNVNVLAVAGATPGNDSFAAYYNRALGNNTFRVWNTLDMIPHGFQPNMLMQIPTLYVGDTLVDTLKIPYKNLVLRKIDSIATKEHLTQLTPQRTIGFTSGYYNPANYTTRYSIPFFTEVLYQHVPGYAVFFGVDSFQRATQRVLNLSNPFFSGGCVPVSIASYDTAGSGINNGSFNTMFK